MGAPAANIRERLQQINAATQSAKAKGRGMQKVARQAYALVLTGSLTMADSLPLMDKIVHNLLELRLLLNSVVKVTQVR